MKKANRKTIQSPCIAVHLRSGSLLSLQRELQNVLKKLGVETERTDSAPHVSLAYANGETGLWSIRRVLSEIQKLNKGEAFYARAVGFALLPGRSTPYDYLSIEVKPSEWFKKAKAIVEKRLRVRSFNGGFKNHISLLRIPKGTLKPAVAKNLIRELNASLFAARALGVIPEWAGECIAVSEKTHRIRYKRSLRAA